MVGLVDAMAFLVIAVIICASLTVTPSDDIDVPEVTTKAHRTLLLSSIGNPCGPGMVSIAERVSMEASEEGLSNETMMRVNETLLWLLGPSVHFSWTVSHDERSVMVGESLPMDVGISTDRIVTNDVHGGDVTIELRCWWS